MRKRSLAILTAAVTAVFAARSSAQLAAFPGAQGFGGDATGGRGGSIYVVTNYNSSGAGSFEDAVSQSNRIIVFAVGGYVDMSAAISCASNLTILGQTAPGQGIAFMGHELSFNDSKNCIVQYIRAREGSTDTSAKASINLGDSSTMILDHIDAEFSQYDNIDAVGANSAADNITLQNSMIADPIKAQQFNMHTEGNNTTYLNNLFVNGEGRSVLAKANSQFVNNVVYDYGYAYTTGDSSGKYSYDILNNAFIAGPGTNTTADAFYQLDSNQSAYSSGNVVDGNKNGVLDGTVTAATTGTQDTMNTLTSEWSASTKYLPTLSTTAAYNFDIAHAGALYPNGDGTFSRDQVDAQVVSQVESLGTAGRIFNAEDDTELSNGGFGTLTVASVAANTLDTVPFSWLMAHGLSTTNAAQLVLPNALGYDMIEEYAQQVGDQYASQTAVSGDWATTSWSAATPGIYDHALIRGTGSANGVVTIGNSEADSAFSVSIGGNGPAAGESLNISGGSLVVQDTIYVGDQNNGTLRITAGAVRTNNVQLGNTVWSADGTTSTTYTGNLILNGGTLTTGQVVLGGGVAGSWTTGGSINWSGGTLQSIGTLNVNVPATLGSGGGILDTNAGTATLSGVIGGTGSLKIIGGGSATLTAANTYTGVTTISGATLSVSPLTNAGAASTLGASSNASANLVLDGGTLAGTGATDRLFTLTNNGGTLDNSNGMIFTNAGSIAVPGNSNVTLTLTGTNTGHETFSPALADSGNGFVTSVIKAGTGKWTFSVSGNKTYSGDTDVIAGTLETLATEALSPDSNVIISSGATLDFHEYKQIINGLSGAGTVTDSFDKSTDTFTIGQANGGGTFSGNLGNGTLPILIKDGTGTQILAGTDTYTGTTTINGGVLQFNLAASIGGTGVSVSIAAGATDAAGYAIDQPFISRITTASQGTAALAFNSANNLDFSSATGANLPSVSLGAVGSETYTGTLTPFGTTYLLGGGGGTLILPNTNALAGAQNVLVSGAGSTVSVTGTDSYTGITTISTGAKLAVSILTNGGVAGGLGISSNSAANLILAGGILAGAGSTDRLFTLTSNGGTLDNSAGVNFTNTGAISLPAGTNVTLTLTGSNTGHETFSPTLGDVGGGFVTSVTKAGMGKWTFNVTGDKTYSGDTDVTAGTLETLAANALSPNSNIVISAGAYLDFHDSSQTINGLSGAGAVVNSFVSHTDTFTIGANNGGGNFTGTISSGSTLNLVKIGTGTETLGGINTFAGSTTVSGGILTIATGGSIASPTVTTALGATLNVNGSLANTATVFANGTVNFGANTGTGILNRTVGSVTLGSSGRVNVAAASLQPNRLVIVTSALTLPASANSWQGIVDLANNDLDVANGSLTSIASQIRQGYAGGTWQGAGGIISSSAALTASHLTTLGAIQNSVTGLPSGAPLYGSGTSLGLFDGLNPASTDVLVKYTYYGDANLDGRVDGSDYTRIDNGFINQLSGWFNGDFNYDGVVDGSDYTLIDNAFNTQGISLSANGTAQIATPAGASDVPEPTAALLGTLAGMGLLAKRRSRRPVRNGVV
jgi:autotransporter-associated beta strand protein